MEARPNPGRSLGGSLTVALGRSTLRDFATDGAWSSRSAPVAGLVLDGGATTAADGGVADRCGDAARFCAALGAQRLRFQFHFTGLREFIGRVRGRFPDDSLFLAMHAFARAGMRSVTSCSSSNDSLARADCDRRARHLCLHALQFADYLPDQAERSSCLCRHGIAGRHGGQPVLPRCVCAPPIGGVG